MFDTKNIKKIILGIAATIFLHTTAAAETVIAKVVQVQPVYQFVSVQVPKTECRLVQVPVYQNRKNNGASGSDVLAGIIVGGLLGQGITGNQDGAAIGAVIGGVVTAETYHNSQHIVGYNTQQRCTQYHVTETYQELKNYRITFQYYDIVGEFYTLNNYNVGDQISVNVGIAVR